MGESSELFVNCLEAMVETCLPVEESTPTIPPPRPYNLSSSLSSLTLGSPTDKGNLKVFFFILEKKMFVGFIGLGFCNSDFFRVS